MQSTLVTVPCSQALMAAVYVSLFGLVPADRWSELKGKRVFGETTTTCPQGAKCKIACNMPKGNSMFLHHVDSVNLAALIS